MLLKNTLSVCLPHPPNAPNTDTPLSSRLSVISGTDNGCPDQKTLYIKVAQNGSTITNTLPIRSPHPSNIPNIEPPPLRTVCPILAAVRLAGASPLSWAWSSTALDPSNDASVSPESPRPPHRRRGSRPPRGPWPALVDARGHGEHFGASPVPIRGTH